MQNHPNFVKKIIEKKNKYSSYTVKNTCYCWLENNTK